MSVRASPAIRELASPQSDPGADASFDARWSAGIERAGHHDVTVKRKRRSAWRGAAVIGGVVALVWLASGAR
jgi:hypothetical protein